MIYTYQIEGIALQTGDIICTMNGKPDILPASFGVSLAGSCPEMWIMWRFIWVRMEDVSKRARAA